MTKALTIRAKADSIVRQGEMNALVATIGIKTYFGKTTKLVEEAKTKPLPKGRHEDRGLPYCLGSHANRSHFSGAFPS
jgi:hypothetical protein